MSSDLQPLPVLMGALRQERAWGTLVLEQNDGCRRLHWADGNLVFTLSNVAGEQFGNYLLRQGILDYAALQELLAQDGDRGARLGDKVVQWGLMSADERDFHLLSLHEQVMLHALEHPLVHLEWKPGAADSSLSGELFFPIDHRRFVWSAFQEAHLLAEVTDLLYAETDWRWTAPENLLETLREFPLTPQVAYALSLLGATPVGFETFLSLGGFTDGEAARLIVTLWAIGGIVLSQGALPFPRIPQITAEPAVEPPPQAEPLEPEIIGEEASEPLMVLDFLPTGVSGASEAMDTGATPVDAEIPQEAPEQKTRRLLHKAKYLLAKGRIGEGIRVLEQAVKLEVAGVYAYECWLLLGKYRMENPAWSNRAIEALQCASQLRPREVAPWLLMADLYHRKGFQANTKACLKRVLELDPATPMPPGVDLAEDVEEPMGLMGRLRAIWSREQKG